LGDSAAPPLLQWIHFNALQFLRDVREPRKTSGKVSVCNEVPVTREELYQEIVEYQQEQEAAL
jgi:hypothetical protein